MKRFYSLLASAVIALLTVSATAEAQQLKWGVRAGLNLNTISMELQGTKHYAVGFHAGPTLNVRIPMTEMEVEAALLYSERSLDVNQASDTDRGFVRSNYIIVPIQLKYNVPLASVVKFFVSAGPSLDFNLSTKIEGDNSELRAMESTLQTNKFAIGLNAGLGFEFFSKFKVGAAYRTSLMDNYSYTPVGGEPLGAKHSGFAVIAGMTF